MSELIIIIICGTLFILGLFAFTAFSEEKLLICGYFLEGFDFDENGNENDEPAINLDSKFYKLSGSHLSYFLDMFDINEEHSTLCFLDLRI